MNTIKSLFVIHSKNINNNLDLHNDKLRVRFDLFQRTSYNPSYFI